jgi:hypothetical protein
MQVQVNVQLEKGEAANWTMTLDEVADAVMKALGGDKKKDYVLAYINNPTPGTAGKPPEGMGTPVP